MKRSEVNGSEVAQLAYRRGAQAALAAAAQAIDNLRREHRGQADKGLSLASKAVLELMQGGFDDTE